MSEPSAWNPTQTIDESGVVIATEDGFRFQGWATLSSLGIVTIVFPEDATPLFPTYTSVDLRFIGRGELDILVERANLFHCRIMPGQITYVFEVEKREWKSLRESLRPRRADRVEPECMVAVNLTTPAGVTRGTIDDISATGLALRIKPADEQFFLYPGALALKFQIPNQRGCLLMIANLRYRRRDFSGLVRCGFEFDAQHTEGFAEQSAIIANYVASRMASGEGVSLEISSAGSSPMPGRTPQGKNVRQTNFPQHQAPQPPAGPQLSTPSPPSLDDPPGPGPRVVRRDRDAS